MSHDFDDELERSTERRTESAIATNSMKRQKQLEVAFMGTINCILVILP